MTSIVKINRKILAVFLHGLDVFHYLGFCILFVIIIAFFLILIVLGAGVHILVHLVLIIHIYLHIFYSKFKFEIFIAQNVI